MKKKKLGKCFIADFQSGDAEEHAMQCHSNGGYNNVNVNREEIESKKGGPAMRAMRLRWENVCTLKEFFFQFGNMLCVGLGRGRRRRRRTKKFFFSGETRPDSTTATTTTRTRTTRRPRRRLQVACTNLSASCCSRDTKQCCMP